MTDADNTKKPYSSPDERTKMINRFIEVFESHKTFLILGHKLPDEDCLASMVATGLLIEKLNGQAVLYLPGEIHEHFNYLLNICRYNSITVVRDKNYSGLQWDSIIVCDTPKPDMIECTNEIRTWMSNNRSLIMEIDHHTDADSRYAGNIENALVDDASSSCELIGELAMILNSKNSIREKYGVAPIMTRNLVLALLTGIVGDSQMGKYFKSEKEKKNYEVFSSMYNEILVRETTRSSNLSTIEELFTEMKRLSGEESACYSFFREHSSKKGFINTLILHLEDSEKVFSDYSYDTVVSISRSMADILSENSGYFGFVAFYDRLDHSDFIQFRIRRSQKYRNYDLRKLLEVMQIKNGGGHEGAIGFRIPRNEIKDLDAFVILLINTLASQTGL